MGFGSFCHLPINGGGGLNGSVQHLLKFFLLGVYEADFVRER